MNLLFLLGSGISYDSELPSTSCLTKFLFDKYFQKTSYERFIETKSDCSNVKGIKSFLSLLRADFENYVKKYTSARDYRMNYEDLYYVLEELISVDESYFKNYSIAYFKKLFQQKHSFEYDKYKQLIKDSKMYISDVVRSSLQNKTINGLNLLNELKVNPDIGKVHIFTLNHDLLIEKYLGDELVDGFKQNGELRYFDPLEYKRNDKKFFLYKLHGSINWFYWSKINPDGLRYPTKLGIKADGNKWLDDQLKDSKGNTWRKEEDIPIFLTGGNKTFRYYYQDYFELHFKFLECLKDYKALIISGYGGSDNLINFRINDWLEDNKNNQCIFLHEKEKIPDYFILKKGCKTYPKWFKDTTLKDIRNILT
jgi:hypothetical protein